MNEHTRLTLGRHLSPSSCERNAVVCADWTELPFAPGSLDLALCDGGFPLVSPHPHNHIRLVEALHRVLAAMKDVF